MKEINAVLKDIRIQSGLSQKDFANRVRMKQNAYSMIELGKNKPSYDLLKTILEEFKLPASVFFDINQNSTNNGTAVDITTANDESAGVDDINNMMDIVKRGVKLSDGISNKDVIFNGYFEENKLAYYLKHSDKRLDGLLSVAIEEFKDLYECYNQLINFSISMGQPEFFEEKFTPGPSFNNYKKDVIDIEFKDTYGEITDKKVIKCTRLIDYESQIESSMASLNKLINYMSRYADMYKGFQKTE